MGSFYKLLVKVLANRLKGVMRNLVNKAQNTFVGGRQILDSSLIANEVIESMINGSLAGFLRSSRGLRQGGHYHLISLSSGWKLSRCL